ncbi:MAG: helix-turn-helix transcriptional regulator [Bacteroidales bacterium]|nr:helix-turn-helix transcriptional regulator [Bacteroidales bacterium]
MPFSYKETDRMSDVIASQPSLLQMICRFGIQLGVGDKTVREVCEESDVDTVTFLAVANFMKNGKSVAPFYVDKVSVPTLVKHLKVAHDFFLNFQLAHIRRKLLDAIDCSRQNEVAFLILKFYDEYLSEVRKHMDFENKRIFRYVDELLAGRLPAENLLPYASKGHEGMDRKLQELKNIIIKYYTPTDDKSSDLLCNVLFSIYNCEADLRQHCEMEDALFIPAVEILEERVKAQNPLPSVAVSVDATQESLSEREKQIVACIVRGMTNKEVAAQLFISVNTVLTHRKNISRKLDIHSVSGLTIYAIVNGIVKIDEVKVQ